MQFDPMIEDRLLCQAKASRRIGVAQKVKATGLSKMVQEPRARFKVAKWGVLCNLPKIGIDHKTIKFV